MYKSYNFSFSKEEIRPLAFGYGGCIASDRVTVDGRKVGYMYRETPSNDMDSGWRFLAGDEDNEYMNDPLKHDIFDVNTIANHDNDIIKYLDSSTGSAFERDSLGHLLPISDS